LPISCRSAARRYRAIYAARRRKNLLGTVNIWEPPNRFGYLWHIGENDASEATQVIVTFTALDSARTRITIEHKGWENAGPQAGPRRRGNERGWEGLIAAFMAFIGSASDVERGGQGGRSSSEGG
jgi:hypothetical protein